MNLQKLFCALLLAPTLALAVDTAYSPPVGGMTITVPAGQTRSVALPIYDQPVGSGAIVGRVTAVGTNYIDVTGAGWTPGAFSNVATPYYLRFTSGPAAGRVMPVSSTANTESRVFVNNDGVSLTLSGGPVAGDAYEIVLADTLNSLFGAAGLQGGDSYLTADNVQVWGGAAWLVFYYNTSRSRWELSTDTSVTPARDNFVLRPDRGVMIARRSSSEFKMYVTGRVPGVGAKHFHAWPGVTFVSLGVPVSVTLGDLALQTRLSGWQSGVTSSALSNADLIQVWGGAAWLIFYYNSERSRWELNTDSASTPSRNTFVVQAGRPIMIRRLGSTADQTQKLIELPMPYSL